MQDEGKKDEAQLANECDGRKFKWMWCCLCV